MTSSVATCFCSLTEPNSTGLSADIHDRMPVRLPAGQAEEWMAAEADAAMAILLAADVPPMEAYRVNRAVNSPRDNVPTLLNQVA